MNNLKTNFTEDELNELLGEDLSLADSLAKLINGNGDLRAFFIQKLEDRQEELATFHLSQSPRWMGNDDFGLRLACGR